MRFNRIYEAKIKLIFSGFIILQIFIILIYFKFGNLHQRNNLDHVRRNFQSIENKLKHYETVLNSFIPEGEATLRSIRGDIVALLFLISNKVRIKPLQLYKQIKLNNINAEDYLNKKHPIIAILIIACNRIGVERTIKQVLKYRPNKNFWPIILSQGCDDANTKRLILKYKEHFVSFVTNVPKIPVINTNPQFKGYYKISAHFKMALDYTFSNFTNVDSVIVVEDDLDIAPDFFEYFSATFKVLKEDASLYCVSAFNDNGRPQLINNTAYSTLHRTDFFPGLGWMLLRSTWEEIRIDWPLAFWDDYMRSFPIRRARSCIRPEISRSSTFGQVGVSNGQFFTKYLKTIKLNTVFTNFSQMDLSYLYIENFNRLWISSIKDSVEVDYDALKYAKEFPSKSVKIIYNDIRELQKFSDSFGLMPDLRDGIPRTSYKGVVVFHWNSVQVFLVPAFMT